MPLSAASQDYKFRSIGPGTVIDGLTLTDVSDPYLADDGKVIFVGGYRAGGSPATALFYGDKAIVKSGDTVAGVAVDFLINVVANDSGEIVFNVLSNSVSGGYSIIRYKDGKFSKVFSPGEIIDGFTLSGGTTFALNDAGKIVFQADYILPDNTAHTAIFEPHRVLVKEGDQIAGHTIDSIAGSSFYPPLWLSKNGTFTFLAFFEGTSGIFTQHRLVAQPGDVVDGQTLSSVGFPGISEAGVVTYDAFCGTTNLSCVFAGDRLVAKSGDVIGGVTLTNAEELALNDGGEAVFYSSFYDSAGLNTSGIFTRDQLLYSSDDTLLGRNLGVSGAVVNDEGEIAFTAVVNDIPGQHMIIVATPKHHR